MGGSHNFDGAWRNGHAALWGVALAKLTDNDGLTGWGRLVVTLVAFGGLGVVWVGRTYGWLSVLVGLALVAVCCVPAVMHWWFIKGR